MAKLIPIYTWNKGVMSFSRGSKRLSSQPWFQGVLLLACVIAAMLLANLPFTKHIYHEILLTNIQINLHSAEGSFNLLFPRDMNVEKFINDILMVIFFFTVGLEIKREITHGELSTPKKALLPVIAAFGGVIVPALIYTIINGGTAASSGWGIPTATDIAFAVCILSVLGDKVPTSMKVFLTALAIADDLVAILVVAFFYGGDINLPLLGISLIVMAFTFLLRHIGEKKMFPYLVCAFLVWVLFYYSGIHATMSGVVMAFLIPSTPRYNNHRLELFRVFIRNLDTEGIFNRHDDFHCVQRICGQVLHQVGVHIYIGFFYLQLVYNDIFNRIKCHNHIPPLYCRRSLFTPPFRFLNRCDNFFII